MNTQTVSTQQPQEPTQQLTKQSVKLTHELVFSNLSNIATNNMLKMLIVDANDAERAYIRSVMDSDPVQGDILMGKVHTLVKMTKYPYDEITNDMECLVKHAEKSGLALTSMRIRFAMVKRDKKRLVTDDKSLVADC